MNTGLLIGAIVVSAILVILVFFLFFYSRHLLSTRSFDGGPIDLTNEHGEIDPVKQIKHLKKTTAEFGIKYDELKFGKLLGKGSQGEVFKASWRGSTIAVKKVDTRKVPPEIIEEFAQEAQIMRRLRHPCLTLFMGVSLEHPHLCILTELVSRGSLFDIIHDEHTALTWPKCVGIAADVARGLTYLHAHSPPILHRDLKSLNILVDENWRAKVADFGMTRFQEDGTMTQCGSPLWMSPEMIRNDAYGEGADVYSFGICLWEMYTRKIPYRDLGLNPSHLVVKVVKEHLRPPIPKQCPKPFKHLMEKCWNPLPEKRPTFPQILKILEGFLADPAIMNHKPMSSRDSTVIVRPERIETEDGIGVMMADGVGAAVGLIGAALGLASGDKAWKVDSREVEFYRESAATFKELADADLAPLSTPSTGGGRGARTKSMQNLNLSLVTPTSVDGTAASTPAPAMSPIASTSDGNNTIPATPTADANTTSDTPKKSPSPAPASTSKKSSSKNRSSNSKTDAPTAAPTAPAEIQAAPLVHNTQIKSTKDAKVDDEAESAGRRLLSQGSGVLLGRFRGKVVAVKPAYVSRTYLVLSNEERVAADLDGVLKDTRLGKLMKRMTHLRHPNITLFQGAYVEGIENLKSKLRESGQYFGTTHGGNEKDITNLSITTTTTQTNAPSHASSSTLSLPIALAPPPPDCEYYVGIVTEVMSRGTLHDILCDSSLVVDWDTMMNLLIDAASGMSYLHGGSTPCIHQDFSSHRLLVDKNWRVKVNEYLFVDLQASLSSTPLPASPWSAPEYIKSPTLANLTQASNVYSFGLVMWQALVRKPLWENRILTKDLSDKILKQNERPHLPNSLTLQSDLKDLIEKCWMSQSHARPTFTNILEELNRIKKLGPPKIHLKLGLNAHKYRKAKTVVAYRSKDPVTIMKDWGTNIGKKNCIIIFSGEDDVYLCDEEVFCSTYERVESASAPAASSLNGDEQKTPFGSDPSASASAVRPTKQPTAVDSLSETGHHEYRKTGTVLARCMEDAFSVKTNGGIEHGMSGDYLVQNEQGDGADQWTVDGAVFEKLYEIAPNEQQ